MQCINDMISYLSGTHLAYNPLDIAEHKYKHFVSEMLLE